MKGRMNKQLSVACILLFGALICFACPVPAQLSGHNSRGDYGLQSGSQAPPGWYLVAPMFYRYSADEFRDRNGDRFNAIDDGRSVEATAWLPAAIWVSEHKVLGGNYSFVVFPGVTNNALEFPPLVVDDRFSASRFWGQVREARATVVNFIGMMMPVLAKQEESPSDRENSVLGRCLSPVSKSLPGCRIHHHKKNF